ncbi:MAG: TerB family tellurite resistance protein [Bacteroidales bacterium]|nr:TerB family tellurite resistance protein [Bacteroidales bacterium]
MDKMKKIKIEHFKNLVAVAWADKGFDKEELALLADKANEFGMTKTEIDEVLAQADTLEFVVPLNDYDKEVQLADVVHMSMVDGEVHEKEYNMCFGIAERLDLSREYLDKIIELTRKLWKNND